MKNGEPGFVAEIGGGEIRGQSAAQLLQQRAPPKGSAVARITSRQKQAQTDQWGQGVERKGQRDPR
jgi:hypothetical protein